MMLLLASDGLSVEVSAAVVAASGTLRDLAASLEISAPIPVPNVSSSTLGTVCDFIAAPTDAGRAAVLRAVRATADLLALVKAANYLHVPLLLDATCQRIASLMRNKTPESLRELFGIRCDFTREEEEEIRRENAWAFENQWDAAS